MSKITITGFDNDESEKAKVIQYVEHIEEIVRERLRALEETQTTQFAISRIRRAELDSNIDVDRVRQLNRFSGDIEFKSIKGNGEIWLFYTPGYACIRLTLEYGGYHVIKDLGVRYTPYSNYLYNTGYLLNVYRAILDRLLSKDSYKTITADLNGIKRAHKKWDKEK